MNLAEQWEVYLTKVENKDYLAERNCGRTGWIPRWMVLAFLQKQTESPKEPR